MKSSVSSLPSVIHTLVNSNCHDCQIWKTEAHTIEIGYDTTNTEAVDLRCRKRTVTQRTVLNGPGSRQFSRP